MVCNLEANKHIAKYLLFTIVAQYRSANCAYEEELELIDTLRHEIGNRNVPRICEYQNEDHMKNWQELWIHGQKNVQDKKDILHNGLLKLHSLLVQDREYPELKVEIVITRTDTKENAKYLLGPTIATGGQGSVSLGCTTTRPKKYVAIKMIHLMSECVSKEAYNEARMYSSLYGLDGFPLMYDSGTYSNQDINYLVIILNLKDIDVLDLLNVCGQKFSLKTSLILCRKLVKLAEMMHKKGIVHRDIKASNLMVDFETSKSKMQLSLVDFGVAERFKTKPAEREMETDFKLAGSYETMSIFTHEGLSPHPRDDTESIFHWLFQAIKMKYPYDDLLSKAEAENITKEEVADLLGQIAEKKKEAGQILGAEYPELGQFFHHVRSIQFHEDPDYNLLDTLLLTVMTNHGIVDDGQFDWDTKTQLITLFQNPNVLNVGITSYRGGAVFRLRFDAFYSPILLQLNKIGYHVTVLDTLHHEARNAAYDGTSITELGIYLTEEIDESTFYELDIIMFDKSNELAAKVNKGLLFAGFGYANTDSKFVFSMVIKSGIQTWNALDQIKLPVAFLQPIWNSDKNNISEVINKRNELAILDPSRYISKNVELVYKNQNPLAVIEEAYKGVDETLLSMIQGKEISEMRMKCVPHKAMDDSTRDVVFDIRRHYDILQDIPFQIVDSLQNFTWSVDESDFNETLKPKSSNSISKGSKTVGLSPFAPQHVRIIVSAASTWFLARNIALTTYVTDISLDKENTNIRMKWQRVAPGKYEFKFTRDSFAESFNETPNLTKKQSKENWILSIPRGCLELRQLANTIATELPAKEGFGKMEKNHLQILFTRLVKYKEITFETLIFDAITQLSGKQTRSIGELKNLTHSASFGYAVTQLFVYGVAVFEPYYLVVLKIINDFRQQLEPPVEPLDLTKSNFSFAETYMQGAKKFLNATSLTKSIHRTSFVKVFGIIPYEIQIVGGVAESIKSFFREKILVQTCALFNSLTSAASTEIKIASFKKRNSIHVHLDFVDNTTT